MTLKTKEEYDILAKAKVDSVMSRYLKVYNGDDFIAAVKYMDTLREGESYWDYCQRTRWDNTGDVVKFTQGLAIEYVSKACMLQDMINNLDYERYNVLIETTDMIAYYPYDSYPSGDSLGFHHSIIGFVHMAKGNVDEALQRMTGENDIFEQFAEEIRSTAF